MPTIVRKKNTGTRDRSTDGNAKTAILDAQVEAALQSLERGVQKRLLQHQNRTSELESDNARKRDKAITKVLDHIRHCWTRLRHNLTVLSAGMKCFMDQLLPSLASHLLEQQRNKGPSGVANHVVTVLQHVFQSLLRLHDGYILTVSGECRHAADVATAKTSRWSSHLNRPRDDDTARDRGRTGLTYATHNTYSGTSWDEWFDPHHGLRHRLHTLLRPYLHSRLRHDAEVFWEEWSELGQAAAPLEAIIVETEQQMKTIQSQFTELRQSKFISVVRRALQGIQGHEHDDVKVTLDWKDKMEQLIVVSTLTGGKLKLERYADNFQVRPGTSVLPTTYTTPSQWWSLGGMELPQPKSSTATDATNSDKASRQAKVVAIKRRKVIADSSDEETTTKTANMKKKPMASATEATGIVVKVVEVNAKPKLEAPLQSSVNEIKMQCGVDVENMEAAFDNLQVEEAGAVMEAELIDNAPEDAFDHVDEATDILHAEKRVKQRKRAFRKAIDRVDYADMQEAYNAIWNARDGLREAMMQVGELILWSDPAPTSLPRWNSAVATERERMLLKAHQYFDDASRLVTAQQKLHVTMRQQSLSLEDRQQAQCYRRNLLLLSGQARTNVGIAAIELVRQCKFDGRSDRKRRLQSSCQVLDGAIESALAMKAAALDDLSGEGSDPTQCRLDSFSAMHLESLALRWKATALWFLNQLPEAYAVFHDASSVYKNGCVGNASFKSAKQPAEVNATVDCRVECYYALTTLADFALASLNQATVLQIRESPERYEVLLDFVDGAISKAASMSMSIQNELGVDLRNMSAKEVKTSDELHEHWKEVKGWWAEKTAASSRNILQDIENSAIEFPLFQRSDLPSGFEMDNTIRTTKRFMATEPTRRRSKYNLGGVGFSNVGNTVTNTKRSQQKEQPQRQYRKWREDMILDKSTGQMSPQPRYPSIAPEMPPHIRAIYERKLQNH